MNFLPVITRLRRRWCAMVLLALIAGYAAPVLALTYNYCSPYQGNSTVGGTSASGNTTGYIATLNEYYFGNAPNFAEIQITNLNGDGTSAAPSSVWSAWSMAITYKAQGGPTTITAPLNQAGVTACYEGQVTYFWIPSAAFSGAPKSLPFGTSSTNQIMLLDGSGNDIDMFASQGTPPLTLWLPNVCSQLTTLNGSLYGNPYPTESDFPSMGNKDLVRVPNAVGAWTVSGSSNGPAASGTTPVISGTSVLLPSIGACTVSPNNSGISITKKVTSSPTTSLAPGATVGFSITVKNQTGTTQAVTVTDTLPTGMTYVPASAVSASSGTLTSFPPTWIMPSLAAGASATLTFNANVNSNVPDGSNLANTVSLPLPPSGSGLFATSTAGITNVVNPLTITKTVDNATPTVGQTVTFTVTVTNKQSPAPTSITVSDVFPAGLTWNVIPSAGSTYSAGVWTITAIGNAALGGTTNATLIASATVQSSTAPGTYTNTAQITTVSPAEPNLGTPFAAASFTVVAAVSRFDACENTSPKCTPGVANFDRLFTKLASQAFSLDLVALKSDGTLAPFAGTVAVDLLANSAPQSVGANNCPASQTAVIPLGNSTLSAGRPTAAISVVSTAFSNVAPNYSAYRDVRVRVTCDSTNCPPSGITYCSADNFSVRPAAFLVTQKTPTLNAGSTFTLQAEAVQSDLITTVTNYTAAPTLNVGQITGTPGFTSTALAPQALPAATLGVSFWDKFTYDDVGSFTLPATSGISDSTFTSVDGSSDCVANSASNTPDASNKIGCLIGQSAALTVGRFYPDHFDITPSFTAGCASGGFTYMDQPFMLGYTVTAKSLSRGAPNPPGNVPLQLYSGGQLNLAAINGSTDWVARLSPAVTNPLSPTWSNGSYTPTSASYKFTRPTTTPADATWGAFDTLNIGVAIDDADGIGYSAGTSTFTGATPASCTKSGATECKKYASLTGGATAKMRFGRLKLSNAYGSELLNLPITLALEYWGVGGWQKNSLDTCTPISSSNFAFVFPVGTTAKPNNLAACETALSVSGSAPNYLLSLSKPGSGNNGWSDLTLNLGATALPGNTQCVVVGGPGVADVPANMSWLQYNWTGTIGNPKTRATFGIYKSPLIYRRENY